MKKYFTLLLLAGLLLGSCKTTGKGTSQLPPGQIKKVTGSKSAKAYAPGQQKKIN